MNDGGRGRASIGRKSGNHLKKWSVQQPAVRSIALLGCRFMVWDMDKGEELFLHLVKRGWPTMFEVTERLPEAKLLGRPQRSEYDRKWIELSIAAEMAKGCTRQRKTPTLTMRPVEDDSSVTNGRK